MLGLSDNVSAPQERIVMDLEGTILGISASAGDRAIAHFVDGSTAFIEDIGLALLIDLFSTDDSGRHYSNSHGGRIAYSLSEDNWIMTVRRLA
jgi:hypothetical protein